MIGLCPLEIGIENRDGKQKKLLKLAGHNFYDHKITI